MLEYLLIFKFLIACIILSLILFSISYFLCESPEKNFEKLSVYECGFHPFSDSRGKFEIKFFLIGILFIIFDVELIYLFPWILVLDVIPFYGILIMYYFILLIVVGFVFEWANGALDWY